MKCPLITAGFYADPGSSGMEPLNCFKEECALWDVSWKRCSFLTATKALDGLVGILQDMLEKMPHAGQFTK